MHLLHHCICSWRCAATSLVLVLLVATTSNAQEGDAGIPPEQLAFFETKIRPVLVEHCQKCHSEEAKQQGNLKANLWLDSRDGLVRGGDSGSAYDSQEPLSSLLLKAIRYEEYEMPPAGKLPASVIDDFERWLKLGAPDPRTGKVNPLPKGPDIQAGREHWAIQPLRILEPPTSGLSANATNPIDAWIFREQAAHGVYPTATADARILVRRLWFDLLGLPPTPEELENALALVSLNPAERSSFDTETRPTDGSLVSTVSPKGWERLVNQLLDRPEYGERWARHWMDVVRFAESFGYEQDYNRPNAYHYRDFLIRALNSDLPYDRFIQWQIAGDELSPENPQAWMATGFLGAGAFPTQLTETEFESTRYNELDDMTATIGVSFLGLSIGCARCHDHKFDPITAQDYYRFASTFTSAIRSEKTFDLAPEENKKRRDEFEQSLRQAKSELANYEQAGLGREVIDFLKRSIEDNAAALSGPWNVLSGTLSTENGSKYVLQADGSFLATGNSPGKETLVFECKLDLTKARALRIEALSDPSLPRGGPGRADNGNFALGNMTAEIVSEGRESRLIQLGRPAATHQQNGDSLSIAASLDTDLVSGWAVDGQIGKSQAAVLFFEGLPTGDGEGEQPATTVRLSLRFHHPNSKHIVGRIRFSVSNDINPPVEVGGKEPPADVVQAVQALTKRYKEQLEGGKTDTQMEQLLKDSDGWSELVNWYKTISTRWGELQKNLSELERKGPPIQLTTVLVTTEGEQHLPHHADDRGYPHFYPQTHLLRRGDVAQKVSVVSPGVPEVFLGRSRSKPDLLWTEPKRNPKSSYQRAALALWLTDVESGAGALAARVMANRVWMHHFGRGLVSTPNDFGTTGERPTHPELLEWLASQFIDQGWSLKALHRVILTSQTYMQGNRLDADPRLAMDPDNRYWWYRSPRRIEAEAVRDSLLRTSGLLDATMYGPGSLDPNMKRRSVYFFIKRSQLIPMMMLFDWPEHLVSIGQRQTTTVAPQALALMNNPLAREAAERLASQAITKPDRVRDVFLKVLSREPMEKERSLVNSLYQDALRERGQSLPSDGSNVELMAFADVCQVLFCSNEFLYVD